MKLRDDWMKHVCVFLSCVTNSIFLYFIFLAQIVPLQEKRYIFHFIVFSVFLYGSGLAYSVVTKLIKTEYLEINYLYWRYNLKKLLEAFAFQIMTIIGIYLGLLIKGPSGELIAILSLILFLTKSGVILIRLIK